MANRPYTPFIKTMMAPGNASNGHGGATIDLLNDTTSGSNVGISVALVNTSGSGAYIFDEGDQDLADIGTGLVDATNGVVPLSTLVFVDFTGSGSVGTGTGREGVAIDGANVQMTSVGNGNEPVDALVLYDDQEGSDGSSLLIGFINEGTGFGFTPSSTTVDITWAAADTYIMSVG